MKKRDELRDWDNVTPANDRSPRFRLPALPVKVPLPQAPATFGISRSALYRAARRDEIKLSKLGRSTLVDTESVLRYLAGLPPA